MTNKITLRDYQVQCLQNTVEARQRGVDRQLIVVATGGGKTEILSRLGEYHSDIFPMLLLAHREELLTQAQDKLIRANPELKVGIEMGSLYAPDDVDVVCASVATLGRNGSPRIERFAPDHFKTIVVDEAHHAAASTYKNVLHYFSSAIRFGFTATPKRADNVRLDDVFTEIVFEKNMLELIREGYLSSPICYRFSSSVDISDVKVSAGDYAVGELSHAVNVDARHEVCVQAFEKITAEIGEEPSTMIFCVDVAHAEALAEYFTKRGYPAKSVSGKTENREEITDAHKAGVFKILTNCQVAVEGYDDPGIQVVIMARPTRSTIFYSQAVGRGARLDGKKNIFYVIDIVDASKGRRPLSILSLMGLPPEFTANGEKVEEVVESYAKLVAESPSQAVTVKSLEDIDAAWERIDLFTPPPVNEALLEFSRLLWMELGDAYIINVGENTRYKIECDQIGVFHVLRNDEKIANGSTLAAAFAYTDDIIKKEHADYLKLLEADATWRSDPPTDKQIKVLKRHNVPWEHLTKGQASQIIDKIFAENPRPEKPTWLKKKIAGQNSNPFNF